MADMWAVTWLTLTCGRSHGCHGEGTSSQRAVCEQTHHPRDSGNRGATQKRMATTMHPLRAVHACAHDMLAGCYVSSVLAHATGIRMPG
eukprot:363309-Chlamydomonas_euryale.AAC.8